MDVQTIGGATIAALILFFTGMLALLTGEGVTALSDIGQIQWIVLGVGAAIGFLKDYQALWTREQIGKVTGNGI